MSADANKTNRVTAPWDLSLIRELPLDGWQAVDTALDTARTLADNYDARLSVAERIGILTRARNLMQHRAEELAVQAAREGGKPLVDSRVEVTRAINGFDIAINTLGTMTGETIPMGLNAASLGRTAWTMPEPIGVVAAISAFNHPVNLIVHQAVPAIAVGCPVIVKPADGTPLSAYSVVEILHEAGLPPEYCQVLLTDIPDAEKLATDTRVDYLSFIGSQKVGWMLRSKLAPGTRLALEHGGTAPVILGEDALAIEPQQLLAPLAKGAFYHSGQVCVSVQRIYGCKGIATSIAHELAEIASGLKVGDPTLPDTECGPLIRPGEVDRVESWVNEAVSAGAQLLCGGQRLSDTCYAPTVLLDPPDDALVTREEIFGPVACVYSSDTVDDAIRRANDSPYAFQASVFTKDIDVAMHCVRRLNAAAVMVNDHTAFRVDWMPFGGRKLSGLGVGGINYAMRDMCQDKLVVVKEVRPMA
ncbi:MAG: aldehyde dehydrogenase family protein [Planctomycetales bacterium]|nr:aldehyde dehydrogenase family protein [bacterium]UNM09750.1 MAG: aldehyde dehydrogenase family protein [Planctomycetales bacterium]